MSSDTLQVLIFICPTVSELRFYGCCHSCLCLFLCNIIQLNLEKSCFYVHHTLNLTKILNKNISNMMSETYCFTSKTNGLKVKKTDKHI